FEYAQQHPLSAMSLVAYKAGLMLNARDLPQIESPGLFNHVAGPLGLPVLGTFAFLGTFGICGLFIGLRRDGSARTLAGMARPLWSWDRWCSLSPTAIGCTSYRRSCPWRALPWPRLAICWPNETPSGLSRLQSGFLSLHCSFSCR